MSSGNVFYAEQSGVHVLRYVGDIRYTLGPSLDRFIEGLFCGPTPGGFIIDLRATQTIDSTNLGLIARIANRMQERSGPRVTIVSGGDGIQEMLECMGFDQIFDILPDIEAAPQAGQAVPIDQPDKTRVSTTVLEAHRVLMALNPRNRERFQDVVDLLERQR
jgi:anti-anti-sigma factor